MMQFICFWNACEKPVTPLNALGAFEAAARHLSFTQAAKEFDVLQPAISRHIAALESDLETTLFIRKKPKLELTRDGETLLTAVSSGFGQIAHAANIIRDRNSTQTFVVTASLGFASCFLMSRLSDFNTRYPDAELELVTSDIYRKYNPDEIDVAIMLSEKKDIPGRDVRLLFPKEMIAVCAPDYLRGRELISDEDLVKEKLLYLHEPNHLEDWNTLFIRFGCNGTTINRIESLHRLYDLSASCIERGWHWTWIVYLFRRHAASEPALPGQ